MEIDTFDATLKATFSHNKTAFLPAIKITENGRTRRIRVGPKNSFLGYVSKTSAIEHAQLDINSMDFEDYRKG